MQGAISYLQMADGAETAQTTAQAAPSARGGRQGRKGRVGNGQGEREVRGATWAVGGGTWQVIARVKHHRAERRCGLKGAGGRQRGACWVLSGGRAERCGVGGQGTGYAAVGSMWWWVACSARRLVLWRLAFLLVGLYTIFSIFYIRFWDLSTTKIFEYFSNIEGFGGEYSNIFRI